MSIEIREIIIRATVGPNEAQGPSVQKTQQEERQALIQECVDQVMDILREKAER